MQRVGFFRRTAALTLDGVALILLTLIVACADVYFHPAAQPTPAQELRWGLVFLFVWLAYTSLEFVKAASPGKALVGLKIVGADGSTATTSRLFLRWSTKWSSLIIGTVAIATGAPVLASLANLMGWIVVLGCLPALGEIGMTWHDQWAGTTVCRVRDLRQTHGFEPVLTQPNG